MQLVRLAEDAEEYGRAPATLTLKWRRKGEGWTRTSGSAPMPPAALGGAPGAAGALVAAAAALLARHVGPAPFHLTLLNLGATGFAPRGRRGTAPALARLLGQEARPGPAGDSAAAAPAAPAVAAGQLTGARRDYGAAPRFAPVSKQAERALAEAAARDRAGDRAHAQLGRPPGGPRAPAPASPAGSGGGDDDEPDFWGGLEDAAAEGPTPGAAPGVAQAWAAPPLRVVAGRAAGPPAAQPGPPRKRMRPGAGRGARVGPLDAFVLRRA